MEVSMSNSTQFQEQAADAARWRELIMLLNRKAYRTNMTPEEIAVQLPDLREIYRTLRSAVQPQKRTAESR
jgi:hypothetical protein